MGIFYGLFVEEFAFDTFESFGSLLVHFFRKTEIADASDKVIFVRLSNSATTNTSNWWTDAQWGKTNDDYNKETDTSNWNTIGNAMMFLIDAGNEETVDVVLETLRQSDDFLDFNYGDIMDYFVKPLLFIHCKDNPARLKPFLLEEGLTSHAKNNVFGALTTIGLRVAEQRENILVLTAEILELYKENLPKHTICDGGCTAFGIDVLVSLGAAEYLPLIEELYATGLVDEYVLGPIKSVRKKIRNPRNYEREVYLTPYEVRNAVIAFDRRN